MDFVMVIMSCIARGCTHNGGYGDDGVAEDGVHTPANRFT